jgi:hypothetical protein
MSQIREGMKDGKEGEYSLPLLLLHCLPQYEDNLL